MNRLFVHLATSELSWFYELNEPNQIITAGEIMNLAKSSEKRTVLSSTGTMFFLSSLKKALQFSQASIHTQGFQELWMTTEPGSLTRLRLCHVLCDAFKLAWPSLVCVEKNIFDIWRHVLKSYLPFAGLVNLYNGLVAVCLCTELNTKERTKKDLTMVSMPWSNLFLFLKHHFVNRVLIEGGREELKSLEQNIYIPLSDNNISIIDPGEKYSVAQMMYMLYKSNK